MTYRRDNRIDSKAAWLFVAVFVAVCLVYVLALSCSEVRAGQWVNIDTFRGLSTHTNALSSDMATARYVDGWFLRNGGLMKPWYKRASYLDDVTGAVNLQPTYIIGQSATGNALLLFNDNKFLRLRDGDFAQVAYTEPRRPDTAFTQNTTDSILHCWEHLNQSVANDSSGRYWLNFALTNRSSLYWGDTSHSIMHFYSNRWILANRALTQTDTLPLNQELPVPNVDELTASLDWPDTTAILDGKHLFIYRGDLDSIVNIGNITTTYPVYKDTGRVINVWERGDSLFIVLDPPDSLYAGPGMSTDTSRFWILWDDTLNTARANPCSTLSATRFTTDSVVFHVMADSCLYASVNRYWGRAAGSGDQNMYALLYQPGKRVPANGYNNGAKDVVSFTYLGKHPDGAGGLHYGTVEVGFDGGHFFPGEMKTWLTLTDSAKVRRLTDGGLWEMSSHQGSDAGTPYQDWAQCRMQWYKADTATYDHWYKFLIFDTDTMLASEWSDFAKLWYRQPISTWSVEVVTAAEIPHRVGLLHRQRSWFAGHTVSDSAHHLRYSNLLSSAGNYATYATANLLLFEGQNNTTALSSFGQTLIRWTRRGAWSVSGFAAGDFYTQPVPIREGVPNNWVLGFSSRGDVIANENGISLFSGSSLDKLSPQIIEVFSDSIEWSNEDAMRGDVFDDAYHVLVPFDTGLVDPRIVSVDLDSREAWMTQWPHSASLWTYTDDIGNERLFFGDKDSSVVWEAEGDTSHLYFKPDWRSSWSDLGDPDQIKVIQSHRLECDPSAYTDTVYVDWYLNLSDTVYTSDSNKTSPWWTDTIPCNTNEREFLSRWPSAAAYPAGVPAWSAARNDARGMDSKRQTIERPVPRKVQGTFFSVGFRSVSRAAQPLTIMRYGFEFENIGRRRR